jgi:hypothetical protein
VGKDFSETSGTDIQGTAANTTNTGGYNPTYQITANNHGLTVGTQVYLRSSSTNINVDKTVPYYVRNANANSFNVAESLGGDVVDICTANNTTISISVTGGGLVDLSGYVQPGNDTSRINHVDAKPASYQTVAASGTYNAGTIITYEEYANVSEFPVTYPVATSYGPGAHVAIGVVKDSDNDVVVLAWYDEVNDRLVYSYNTDPAGDSSAGQWQTNAKEIEENAGEGVSLAVDSDGGIHLSYYSSNGADLKYAYASSYSGDFTPVMVDAYLSVGTQSTITVGKDGDGKQVPYISYYATGAGALRAKIAYRDYEKVPGGGTAVAGADNMDRFTGVWEVSTVPTKKTPSDYRISVGVHTEDGTLASIPGGPGETKVTGADYTGGVAVDPPTRVYGNGTLNPVVGYGTSTNLEMAQKK